MSKKNPAIWESFRAAYNVGRWGNKRRVIFFSVFSVIKDRGWETISFQVQVIFLEKIRGLVQPLDSPPITWIKHGLAAELFSWLSFKRIQYTSFIGHY